MEIIPILSTIILVATIATFILAIAAYVLYKVRERRARQGGVVRTDVAMNHDTAYMAPQPALMGQPYAPNALPPMQPVGPTLALPAPSNQTFAGMPGMGMQGMANMNQPAPLAVDTNADGRYDTVYEPRPTYQDPMTGAPAAYQPAPDTARMQAPMGMQGPQHMQPYGMPQGPQGGMQHTQGAPGAIPGMPGVQSLPGMSAAPAVTPIAPPQPALGAPVAGRGSMFYEVTQQGLVPTPGAATAAEQERARLGAIQREQDRLETAEEASKDRLDTLRRGQDAPAWL